MSDQREIDRRSFVKLCASAVAAVLTSPHVLGRNREAARIRERVRLVDGRGRAVAPDQLEIGKSYIFHYPYVSTPCFLLNVGRPVEGKVELATEENVDYQWKGGAGPRRSVVAFSAICSHRMTHPARSVSFIDYRHEETTYLNEREEPETRSNVIYCCSENSVYDVASGARVLGGPAPQPLAAILLDYAETEGCLYAVGTQGGTMFDRYFGEFAMRLSLEYGTSDIRRPVSGETRVVPLREFTENQVRC